MIHIDMKKPLANISCDEMNQEDTLYVESTDDTAAESGNNGKDGADEDPLPAAESDLISTGKADEMVREAYLRGRNEAIASAMAGEAHSPALEAANLTPGVATTETPPSDPDLAEIFSFRPSVWQ